MVFDPNPLSDGAHFAAYIWHFSKYREFIKFILIGDYSMERMDSGIDCRGLSKTILKTVFIPTILRSYNLRTEKKILYHLAKFSFIFQLTE